MACALIRPIAAACNATAAAAAAIVAAIAVIVIIPYALTAVSGGCICCIGAFQARFRGAQKY